MVHKLQRSGAHTAAAAAVLMVLLAPAWPPVGGLEGLRMAQALCFLALACASQHRRARHVAQHSAPARLLPRGN